MRPVELDCTTEQGWSVLSEMRSQALLLGKGFIVQLVPHGTITQKQVNALNLWCGQVADCLVDAGLDMKAITTMDIPATKYLVKENLYKPTLEAMTGKASTMEQDTVEPSAVAEVLARYFAEVHGLVLPFWPRKE